MQFRRFDLSKKWTDGRYLFGLFALAAALSLPLVRGAAVRAETVKPLPPGAFETPYFAACKGVPLMEADNYGAWVTAHRLERTAEASREVMLVPEHAPTAESLQDDLEQYRFYRQVVDRVDQYLSVSAFHADLDRACVGLLTRGEGEWFRGLGREPGDFKDCCSGQVGDLLRAIELRWSPMRIALSISAPAFREDRLRPDVSSRIHPHPQHALGDVAEMPPLTEEEKRSALALVAAEESRLREEFRAIAGARPSVAYGREAEDRYVMREIEPFRKKWKGFYWRYLDEMPLLALVSTGRPGGDELVAALDRIRDSSEATRAHMKGEASRHPDIYLSYDVIIDQILEAQPRYCGLAHAWKSSQLSGERISLGLRLAITAAAGLESYLGRTLLARVGAELIGIGANATYVVNGFRAYRIAEAKAFSSVVNQQGIVDFRELSRERQHLLLVSAFLPGKVAFAKVSSVQTRAVLMQLLREKLSP